MTALILELGIITHGLAAGCGNNVKLYPLETNGTLSRSFYPHGGESKDPLRIRRSEAPAKLHRGLSTYSRILGYEAYSIPH